MTAALARLLSVTALCFACASADVSGGSSSEPAEPQASSVAPTSSEPISVAKLCEHVWALVSAESAGEVPVAGFESYLEECVAGGEEERRSIGEDAFEQQAACALAAASVAELLACDPDPGPPPSPREPARFPEGALVRPLSEVVDHAIYSPDPDSAELQQTKAARFDRADGMSTVAFCVETNGSTAHIHTVQKFPGDPKVDEIIRDTVAGWRFKPFIVDGAAVEVCTEKSFSIRFK